MAEILQQDDIDESIQTHFSVAQLREAMRNDCVTFFSVYLGDQLTLEVPELHEEIWDELVKIVRQVNLRQFVGAIRKLFCVPRGHAKSTLTKLAVILFLRYSRLRFALYASLTSNIAKAACRDIVNWLTSPNDQAIFGSTTVIKSNETEQLWILEIGTPDFGRKVVTLKALGADQQVRGTLINNNRPDLLVIDDCEDRNTAKDAASQLALDEWLMGALLKATARNSVQIMLGNMINKRTALYRFSRDPKWNPTIYGAIIRDKSTSKLRSLWPGLYSLDALLAEYQEYRRLGTGYIWVYEMMNLTMDTVFKVTMENAYLVPRPNPDQIISGIITVDPAFGLTKWNDHTAIVVHGMIRGISVPIVLESRKARMNEDKMFETLLELSYYWNLSTWGIESVAAQRLLIPLFRGKLREMNINPELFLMLPLQSGNQAKNSRILAFVNSVGQGNYAIAEEESDLLNELAGFNPAITDQDDDLPDAAAYGLIAWGSAGQSIRDNGLLRERMALLQSQESTNGLSQNERCPY